VWRLSRELFGRSIPLPEFPRDKSIRGIGLTDPDSIARVLADRLSYRNTYLDAEPRLDIRSDPPPLEQLDFLIASEVFEHIQLPVSQAFQNVSDFLKPSGVFLLTVPWVWDGDRTQAIPELYDWRLAREHDRWVVVNRKPNGDVERFYDMAFDGNPGPSIGWTREHFPELHKWKLIENGQNWCLSNTRRDGTVEIFYNLVFHEGPGLALEMRLFSKHGVETNLTDAGFDRVEFETQESTEHGILFPYPWSRPIVARRHGSL
jgi:hypothetical protein